MAYAAVSWRILGIGSKLFAIPWKAFSLRIRDNAFILDIPEETFDKAEGFDKSHWPLTRQELSGTFTHYGFEPYWQAAAVGAGVSAGVMGETEAEKMSRMERERKGLVKTDEELKARQERERLEGLKETQEEKSPSGTGTYGTGEQTETNKKELAPGKTDGT